MDGEAVADLVKQLVSRIFPPPSREGRSLENPGIVHDGAFSYAMRIIGSRIAPSLSKDENATAEAIKRKLVLERRSGDALAFADLYRRLVSQSSAGGLDNRWAILYLLRAVAEDQSRESAKTRGTAVPFTSTLLGPASYSGLPVLESSSALRNDKGGNGGLDFPAKPRNVNSGHHQSGHRSELAVRPSGGLLLLEKDTNNVRASALREFAEIQKDDSQIAEVALVRDVLFVCQGIEGRYIKYDKVIEGYAVSDEFKVPRAIRTLVRRLCEVGWLFKRVRNHVSSSLVNGHIETIGTVGQAFVASLQEELSDYYRLMAVLESQAHIPIPCMGADDTGNYLSLRRLSVWLAEPLVRIRLMAVMVDDCQSLRGGEMAAAIHMHAQHGDPLVHNFIRRLLRRVCSPLFEMVRRWVLEGEVDDLHGEFFVVAQSVKAEALWREGYHLQSSMLPSFIPEPLAQLILRTGKSINFLRGCCEDQDWVKAATDAVTAAGTLAGGEGLGYGETEALESLVVEAARRIDQHLLQIIFNRYKFREHCLAIKRYLLLGQGDFIQYLMDLVGSDLSQSANTVSSFRISGILESAIRASNAQYDDGDVLDRLRVKMMPYGVGDRGWDVFSLDYSTREPLNTIFSELVMAKYLRIFNFLWRLKRVEHALSATWQTMKPNCVIAQLRSTKDGGDRSQLAAVLRRCQTLRNEMNHFVTNLQYYIMFEVLECSWSDFLQGMDSACDLDELIAAHEKYLDSIIEKSLLGERSQLLCKTLCSLFDLILRFRGLADRLYENARELDSRLVPQHLLFCGYSVHTHLLSSLLRTV